LTKATNDEHFVVVDIEAALQKVGNTLRCRKNWNKIEKTVNSNSEGAVTQEGATPQRKVPVMTTTTTTASPQKTPTAPQATNSSYTMSRLPPVSPLMLSRRKQTMSLLRENTVRLIQKLPLRPATADDVLYLQQRKPSPWYPCQLRSQPIANIVVKGDILSHPQRPILSVASSPVSGGAETAGVCTGGQKENRQERDSS